MKQFVTREHEIEPSPGLPGMLPRGETVLWQGRPSARLVSRHVLKTRWIAGYFLALALWGAWAGYADGHGPGGILFSVAVLVALAALAIGLIEAFAWGVEKTTLYTVTNERIVMRFGVALSMTLNLPYRQIDAASLRSLGGDAGSISIALAPGHRVSWLVQWPHARFRRVGQVEPAMICLTDAHNVASIMRTAIEEYRLASAVQPRIAVRKAENRDAPAIAMPQAAE
ncbi:photosynthetic complex putative assembly protein PuhB [Zhengella sp. ZM62]|uniref:photosynthetic complex putative assembly protein PuhB n=1 Tax=Zhengella sedimenti TaxID=3390035 RepID=UPI0039761DBB